MSVLEVRHVGHSYKKHEVLKDVSLDVLKGGITALVGPSGCGKTTLLKVIAGIEPVQTGEVMLGGVRIDQMPLGGRDVGMVFQHPSLFPHMTVIENVMFAAQDGKKREIALSYLSRLHMDEYQDRYPHMLSGGQQQRVAIARSLAAKPSALLFDEPFAHLDVLLRRHIREETFLLLKEEKVPTLFVTHDPDEALHMADTIYVMEDGRVVQQGDGRALYDAPASPFVASFFGELNCVEGVAKDGKVKTVLGSFSKGVADGKVEVFIRPEDIELVKTGGVKLIVDEVRFLGAMSVMYLREGKSGIDFRMRVHGAVRYSVGDTVHVKVRNILMF